LSFSQLSHAHAYAPISVASNVSVRSHEQAFVGMSISSIAVRARSRRLQLQLYSRN